MSAGEGWGSERFEGLSGGDIARWGLALLLVLGGGYALSQGAKHLPTPALTLGEPEPAILIDLAPMEPEAVVPEDVEPVAEVPPEPAEAPPPEQPPEPVPMAEPPMPEEAEAPTPVEPEAQQPAKPEPQALPESVPSEVVPPQEVAEAELPAEEPPLPAEPVEEIVETVSDVPMPVMISPSLQQRRENTPALPKPVVRQPAPQAQSAAPPAPRAQASAPTISPQQWQAQALAQLDRRKVYPRSAQADGIQGTVDISFSVSESGQITAVSVARSSGSSILDQAALETARRASPLPAPPAGYANRAMTAAIRFALR